MFGRSTRSILPAFSYKCRSRYSPSKRNRRQKAVKKQYDKTARNMPELKIGQPVSIYHPDRKGWFKGEIFKKLGDRSYIVKCSTGVTYRRNHVHIRPRVEERMYKSNIPSY